MNIYPTPHSPASVVIVHSVHSPLGNMHKRWKNQQHVSFTTNVSSINLKLYKSVPFLNQFKSISFPVNNQFVLSQSCHGGMYALSNCYAAVDIVWIRFLFLFFIKQQMNADKPAPIIKYIPHWWSHHAWDLQTFLLLWNRVRNITLWRCSTDMNMCSTGLLG